MNTFVPYTAESACILKGGDTADDRMTELDLLIASGKGNVRPARNRDPMRTRLQRVKFEKTNSTMRPAADSLMLDPLERISPEVTQLARTYVAARNLVIETLLVKLRYERHNVTSRICYFERLAPSRQESEMSSAKERGRPPGSKNHPKE